MLSRNKKSIALDLKNARSIEIIRRLIREKGYTIVVEQFRPGAMARLGLSFEELRECDPGLIYCSITGYGQTGPLRERAGHDINYLALSGVMSYSGRKGSGPCQMGIQVADVGSGSNNAVIGILAAVIHRMKTGEGQHIDVSMTDGMFPHHVVSGIRALVGDEDPCFESELLNGASIYRFETWMANIRVRRSRAAISHPCSRPWAGRLYPHGAGISDELRMMVADVSFADQRLLDGGIDRIDACVDPVLSFSRQFEASILAPVSSNVPGPDGVTPDQPAHILFGYRPEYRCRPRWAVIPIRFLLLNIDDDEIQALK